MTTLERILAIALVLLVIGYVLALDNSERERAKQDIYIAQLETEKGELLRLVDVLTPLESPIMGLIKKKPVKKVKTKRRYK